MGCDIHAYVEYRPRVGARFDGKPHSWRDFGKRINLGRNYSIFGAMTNGEVRGGSERGPGVSPRGRPDDLGYAAMQDAWIRIVYDREPNDEGNECSPERAKQWAGHGCEYRGEIKPYTWTSYVVSESGEKVGTTTTHLAEFDGMPAFVSDPDSHSHSWLTTEEFASALAASDYATPHAEPGYHALLAAMRSLEASGYEARLVFWFDN